MPILLPVLTCALALAGVLASEHRGSRWGNVICKPLASLSFLAAALAAGATATPYGRTVLLGLALCAAGDVCLLGRRKAALLAGLGTFLLGHVAYGVAFLRGGVAGGAALAAGLALLPAAVVALALLWRHVPGAMRPPVVLYVVVISAMATLAWGHAGGPGPLQVGAGATCFWLSDVGVARDRFVARSPWQRSAYLPLYYAAQILLATSVAAASC